MAYGPFDLESYACAICGAPDAKTLGRKRGLAVPMSFRIVQCRKCGHVRIDPRIADERLGEMYDDRYYRGNGFDSAVNYDGSISAWTSAENAGIIATVASALGGSIEGVQWLDIGCATGTLLEEIGQSGGLGIGFDESETATNSCALKHLVTLSKNQLLKRQGSFDVVSAVEVIEHVPDPLDFIRFMTSMVRVGGIVYVQTENWNVIRRLPGTPYIMPEGHIQYFTPQVMRRLFAMCGLTEANLFNRSWFLFRRLPQSVKHAVSESALIAISSAVLRFAPGYAPMPVGVRAR